MKNVVKLVIPLILGLIAGVFNFMALKTSVEEISFIKATREIAIGEVFEEGSVEELRLISKHAESLTNSAILFEDMGLLSGQRAARTIQAGDIIFHRDREGSLGHLYDFRDGDSSALPVSLDGITAPPRMRVGDYVMLKVPLEQSSDSTASEWIGPFRLTSVGEEISTTAESGGSSRISVAYEKKSEAMLKKLEDFIDRSRVNERIRLINIKLLVDKDKT